MAISVAANPFDRMWAECGPEILDAFDQVGKSGWYVLGRCVSGFEDDLAAYCNASSAVGCANGMDALEISLRAAGIRHGDQVLTTPLSAFATGLAILRTGAEPIYADVDSYGLLAPDAVAHALNVYPGIKAIVPVHLFGHLADTLALKELADTHGAVLIEDAAQAIGASRMGTCVGQHGLTACFSFYPTKNLGTLGDGGAIVTDDVQIAEISRSLRNYGQTKRYVHEEIGMNSRLDEVHAAILKAALLPRLAAWTNRRRNIAKQYMDKINNVRITLPGSPDLDGSVWHLFPVLVPPQERAEFLTHLSENDVQSGLHYPILIPDQKAVTNLGEPNLADALDNAKLFAESEVSLPISPFLSDQEVEHVIATANSW